MNAGVAAFQRGTRPRPLILGHRGARAKVRENTLDAFYLAMADGADGVELDVRMTSDGVLVIHHDPELVTPNGMRVKLGELSFAQVQNLSSAEGWQLPTLDDVLKFQDATGALLNVELKGDVAAPTWMTDRALQKLAGRSNVLISSFDWFMVGRAARSSAALPTALLIDTSRECLARWAPLRALGAVAAHPHHSLLQATTTIALRARGAFALSAWTVNDGERAVELARLGVDSIITDCPDKILSAFESPQPLAPEVLIGPRTERADV